MSVRTGPRRYSLIGSAFRGLFGVMVLAAVLVVAIPSDKAVAQGSDFADAQEEAAEQMEDASPEEREEVEGLQSDEGPIEEANDDAEGQMEDASPEEEEAADSMDPGRDEPSEMGEAQEEGAEQMEDASAEEAAAADRVDGEGGGEGDGEGPINGLAIGMFEAIWGFIADRIEGAAKAQAEDMSEQITEGRYMLDPPNNGLVAVYEDTSNWAKPGAIALLLVLALSMTLRATNYNTAYAAQTGIPKIVVVLAGIAFFPEIIDMIAGLTRSMSEAVVDEAALQEGLQTVYTGNMLRPGGITSVVWIAKLILSVLIIFAIAVRNLLFGILFVIGPLAMIFHAIPRFSDVAAAWLRGMLACFAISVLWALEFGIGFRFVADPDLIFSDGIGSGLLPVMLSLGIVYLVWKTPWWVYQWAFYSYSTGGGSGARTAISALGLLKLFRGAGK